MVRVCHAEEGDSNSVSLSPGKVALDVAEMVLHGCWDEVELQGECWTSPSLAARLKQGGCRGGTTGDPRALLAHRWFGTAHSSAQSLNRGKGTGWVQSAPAHQPPLLATQDRNHPPPGLLLFSAGYFRQARCLRATRMLQGCYQLLQSLHHPKSVLPGELSHSAVCLLRGTSFGGR